MGLFARFGDLIIKTVSFIGMLILYIPKIPQKIGNINKDRVRQRIDTENMKGNISRISEGISDMREKNFPKEYRESKQIENSDIINTSGKYTSEEKERTILTLQLASGAFIIFAILHIFNFLPSFFIFLIIDVVIAAFILYTLFNKVKLMYPDDFNAYRDFFLMYLAVGVIIVLVSGNSNLVMAFSFQSLPSLSILIYAIIAVVGVFLLYRIRYYRNYTYGTVLEAGENTAHVKVEYDIRSNVKPDLYIVENNKGAKVGDTVKLKIEEKLISTGGNKPLEILEIFH
ncbi:MAG: DUF2101 family protein [Methanobacterium sp.]|nr:DUF2101 family protein [Methanobacterium sp.]